MAKFRQVKILPLLPLLISCAPLQEEPAINYEWQALQNARLMGQCEKEGGYVDAQLSLRYVRLPLCLSQGLTPRN